MAQIAPLTPLRYDLSRLSHGGGGLQSVVAPPYDVIDQAQRQLLADRDPHNIVNLILPEGEGDAKYAHAGRLLDAWIREGVFLRDDEPAYYKYEQTFAPPGGGPAITRQGFLALVRLVPLDRGIVLPHERTLSGPKEDRLKLFRATQTNLSPGFMLYRDKEQALNAPLATAKALTDFSTADGIRHVLSKVTSRDAIVAITEGIAKSQLLIADGHHRYETALRYSGEAQIPAENDERAEPLFFMTFLANGDDPNLMVFPTHRHVHSLPSFAFEALVARAAGLFTVAPLAAGISAAEAERALRRAGESGPSFAVFARGGEGALFTLAPGADVPSTPLAKVPEVLRRTDVAVLHSGILEHLLGITPEAQAAKTNIWYPQDGERALAELRGGRGDALFLMNPTPIDHVRSVAEAGHVMPQKSTFFFPKVLTGLAVHTLLPHRTVALVR